MAKCKTGYKKIDGKCVSEKSYSKLNSPEKSKKRAIIFLLISLIPIMWVLINSLSLGQGFSTTSIILLALWMVSMLVITLWDKWFGEGKNGLFGIDRNYIMDAGIGVGCAIGFLALSNVFGIVGAIGIPILPESLGTFVTFLVVVVATPPVEEFFFREILTPLFGFKIFGKKSDSKIFYLIGAIASSALFAVFHFYAYGASLSGASGSFISAFFIGMGFCYIRKLTNSNIGNITAHAVMNTYIFSMLSVIVT
jgi:membrane protease YdiL (CAAX protease family)